MRPQARVNSLDALSDFRATLCTFGKEASDLLASVQLAIQKTQDWLDGQVDYWKRETARWEDAVIQAKIELSRRKAMRIGDRAPDCTEQEAILKKARFRLEEAQEKLAKCKRWVPQLRRDIDEYQGPARQLSSFLEADQQRALVWLDQKIDALDRYINLRAPAAAAPPPPAAPPAAEAPE